jgi:drug/metabolite transporter (DMT)-like permease
VRAHGTYRVNALISLACLPVMLAAAAPELARTDWSLITPLAWAGLLYSAIVAYALTNLIWFVAVSRVGAARAAVYANLQPFFGALFALVLISEPMAPLQWAGGIAIAPASCSRRRPTPQIIRIRSGRGATRIALLSTPPPARTLPDRMKPR